MVSGILGSFDEKLLQIRVQFLQNKKRSKIHQNDAQVQTYVILKDFGPI